MPRPALLALRHVPFEDPGLLAPLAEARGMDVVVCDMPGRATPPAAALEADLLVVLGGPISANDGAVFPFIEATRALIAARDAAGAPVLGICLGAQIIARALGADVAPAAQVEIGWAPLELMSEGRNGLLGPLAPDQPVLHWHGENMALPEGATLLARTATCPVQAFSRGRPGAAPHLLALQFHLEVAPDELEPWYVGHTAELGAHGIAVDALRQQAAAVPAGHADRAAAVFGGWLDALGL